MVSLREANTNTLLFHHESAQQSTSFTFTTENFSSGYTYRVAVGAVAEGTTSSDPTTGWCERIFRVEQPEDDRDAELLVIAYELSAGEVESESVVQQRSMFVINASSAVSNAFAAVSKA